MELWQYYRYDGEGRYVEPVLEAEPYGGDRPMPEGLTEVRPPDGLYRAMWDGGKWVETGTPPPEPEREAGAMDILGWIMEGYGNG